MMLEVHPGGGDSRATAEQKQTQEEQDAQARSGNGYRTLEHLTSAVLVILY